MARKAVTRGRPKRAVAAEAAPVTQVVSTKKRGRPAKTEPVDADTEPRPKRRGRPARVNGEQDIALVQAEEPNPRGRGGRPSKQPPVEVDAPKKRSGHPRKEEIIAEAASAPPQKKRIDSPPKNALDLNRVAGSPRVAKRTSPRSKTVPKNTPAPRVDSCIRSKLRTRQSPSTKTKAEEAVPPSLKKAPGRPRKASTAVPSTKKAVERKVKDAGVKKPTAPRKRRGYTNIEVPDNYVAQVKEYLKELINENTAAEGPENVVADEVNASNGTNREEDIVQLEDNHKEMDKDVDAGTQEEIQVKVTKTIEEVIQDEAPEHTLRSVQDAQDVQDVQKVQDVQIETDIQYENQQETTGEEKQIQEETVQVTEEILEDGPNSLFDQNSENALFTASTPRHPPAPFFGP